MRPIPRLSSAAAALALTVLISACGTRSAAPTHAASTAPRTSTTPHTGAIPVTISGYTYQPAKLTVVPGTKITFTNHDHTPHTATSTKTGFDSGTINPGKHATITITKPGTYPYYCQFHAFMHGTITVR